ncbi:hypothetical protein [Cochleicola gelatinilyticus]|nr:hypothetical protein [Cochleicola gelatinilyticus]
MKHLKESNRNNAMQLMARSQVASINNVSINQTQTEQALNKLFNQKEALEAAPAEKYSLSQKRQLSSYYDTRIKQLLRRLSVFLLGPSQTARAIKINVVQPEIL